MQRLKRNHHRHCTVFHYMTLIAFVIACFHFANLPKTTLKEMPQGKKKLNTAAIVVVYSGKLARDTSYFIDSLADQSTDVLFVSADNFHNLTSLPSNMRQLTLPTDYYNYTIGKLCLPLAYNCTTAEQSDLTTYFSTRDPDFKYLKEFRPMYSWIFQDYLKQYEYVGYGNLDVVWNDFDRLLPYLKYDVVTVAMTNDLHQLYLRAQFTIFRNAHEVKTSFKNAFPLPKLKTIFNTDDVSDEGLYSQYMHTSNFTLLQIPLQSSSRGCKEGIAKTEDGVECLLVDPMPIPEEFKLNGLYMIRNVPELTMANCSTTWLEKEYRMCLKEIPPSFMLFKDAEVKIYPMSLYQTQAFMRHPLFYNFQWEKPYFTLANEEDFDCEE